jgi:hypothetical protein
MYGILRDNLPSAAYSKYRTRILYKSSKTPDTLLFLPNLPDPTNPVTYEAKQSINHSQQKKRHAHPSLFLEATGVSSFSFSLFSLNTSRGVIRGLLRPPMLPLTLSARP